MPTLEANVAKAAKAVKREPIMDTLRRLVMERAVATVPPAPPPPPAPKPDLEELFRDPSIGRGGSTSGRARRTGRRGPKASGDMRKVTPVVTSAWASGLRAGTKRFAKLAYVLKACEANNGWVRVYVIAGEEYAPDKYPGDRLDAHDINGMAERRHITLGD